MFDINENTDGSNRSRRDVLRGLASVGVVSSLGAGVASAGGRGKDVLLGFDPNDQAEVRAAYRRLSSLPDRAAVDRVLANLSDAQVAALREVNGDTEVVTVVEAADGTRYRLSGDDDSVSVMPADGLVSISAVGDNTVTAVSKLKNWAGTTEATFKHHVYWEYDGTSVMNESHWHEASTGVLYTFDGLSTNYLDNRGDEAVSRKIADFSSCIGGPCVTKHLGTEIWMFENGGWTVNEL